MRTHTVVLDEIQIGIIMRRLREGGARPENAEHGFSNECSEQGNASGMLVMFQDLVDTNADDYRHDMVHGFTM